MNLEWSTFSFAFHYVCISDVHILNILDMTFRISVCSWRDGEEISTFVIICLHPHHSCQHTKKKDCPQDLSNLLQFFRAERGLNFPLIFFTKCQGSYLWFISGRSVLSHFAICLFRSVATVSTVKEWFSKSSRQFLKADISNGDEPLPLIVWIVDVAITLLLEGDWQEYAQYFADFPGESNLPSLLFLHQALPV